MLSAQQVRFGGRVAVSEVWARSDASEGKDGKGECRSGELGRNKKGAGSICDSQFNTEVGEAGRTVKRWFGAKESTEVCGVRVTTCFVLLAKAGENVAVCLWCSFFASSFSSY